MQKLTPPPTMQGPEQWFTGQVWFDQIYAGSAPSRARVNTVRFAPGSHTAWHSHAMGQTLHCTDGVGLVVTRDGTAFVLRPGDTVHTPPDEWHWHGALSGAFMTHLAIWEGTGDPDVPETTWGEHISDEQYDAAQP